MILEPAERVTARVETQASLPRIKERNKLTETTEARSPERSCRWVFITFYLKVFNFNTNYYHQSTTGQRWIQTNH